MAGIEENIQWIIITAIILAVILYAMFVFIIILKRRIRVRDATREIALLKMDLLSKQAHLENLIEDSVEWTPKDLRSYDSALDQNRMLKSKLDTGMVIADSRLKRLELGNQTADLFETLEKIKSYEDKLFGEEAVKEGRR
jgi:hypothetical protein